MLFLSIGLWCVIVHSVRVAVFGDPLYVLLNRAGPELVMRVDRLAAGEELAISERELYFIRRISRLTMLEVGALLLEVALLSYLYITHGFAWLSMGLLVKNLALLALNFAIARSHARDSLLASLRQLPSWLVLTERFSAVVSGTGCLILFLVVNGYLH